MKKILVILFVAFAFSAGAQTRKTEKAVIQTAIYCDHCKECETCGKQFDTGMLKVAGVKMFAIDQEKSTITVYYNPAKTTLDAIRTAISKMGYDADEVKADMAAYEKLDGCCKKG